MHLLTWNYCILAGVLMVSPFVISAPNTGGSHPVAIICFFLLVFSSVVLTRDNNSLKKRKTVLGLAYFWSQQSCYFQASRKILASAEFITEIVLLKEFQNLPGAFLRTEFNAPG